MVSEKKEVQDSIEKLHQLRDENHQKALEFTNQLGDSPDEQVAIAVTLIDSGDALENWAAVDEGVAILEALLKQCKFSPDLEYNLANGLQIRARLTCGPISATKGQAFEDRFRARVAFGKVMSSQQATNDLKSQMSTNTGILLLETHRWVEALDFFQHALELLPRNGVAAFQEMRRLMGLANLFSREEKTYRSYCDMDGLLERVRQLSEVIAGSYDIIEEFAGEAALPEAQKAVGDASSISKIPQQNIDTPYFAFVKKNSLALSLHCSSKEFASGRFDLLNIPSVKTGLSDGPDVPEIFAMMNVMKTDFAFARQIFFDAKYEDSPSPFFETTSLGDSLDYALYGVRFSALTASHKMAFDILDKIAVALSCYLKLKKPHRASFVGFWGKTSEGGKFVLDAEVDKEMSRGNAGLISLYGIFQDISKDNSRGSGFMQAHKHYRNSSTHRFTVLHDMIKRKQTSSSRAIEHLRIDDFETLTLMSLKLARAALFYFVDAIVFSEAMDQNDQAEFILSSSVPDHDYIRGRK